MRTGAERDLYLLAGMLIENGKTWISQLPTTDNGMAVYKAIIDRANGLATPQSEATEAQRDLQHDLWMIRRDLAGCWQIRKKTKVEEEHCWEALLRTVIHLAEKAGLE